MYFFIQVENGLPINHPAYPSNLIQAYGEIPSNWEPFLRVQRPIPKIYEVLESDEPTYQKVDGIWKDVWALRPMTDEEKNAKQQAVKDAWAAREQAANWDTWVFNENICNYEPPIPRPELDETKISQGIMTFWCGVEGNWKDTPPRPEGLYKFDFFAWTWVQVNK